MSDGWIKLHRKILDGGMLRNGNLTAFWIWCLLKATHKPYKTTIGNQTIELNPGEFIFKRIVAVEDLALSEKTVRSCLDTLKSGQQITVKATNKFSIVSIINWDIYQDTTIGEGPTNIDQQGQQRANKGPTNAFTPIINKNIKNIKNIETTNVVSPASFPDKPEITPELAAAPPEIKKPEIKLTEFKIPLVTVDKKTGQKTEYTVSQRDFDEWVEAYPAVDVPQALRSMRQWTLSNLDRAKKDRGIRRFITNWLDREQNRGGIVKTQVKARSSGTGESVRRMTFTEQEELLRLQGLARLRYKIEGEAGLRKFCEDEKLDFDEVKKWI